MLDIFKAKKVPRTLALSAAALINLAEPNFLLTATMLSL